MGRSMAVEEKLLSRTGHIGMLHHTASSTERHFNSGALDKQIEEFTEIRRRMAERREDERGALRIKLGHGPSYLHRGSSRLPRLFP